MSRISSLTQSQKQQIAEFKRQGLGFRKIAPQMGLSESQVRTELEKQGPVAAVETVLAISQEPAIQDTVRKNVFDITAGLQDCLENIEKLMAVSDAPLKERVQAVNTQAQIYMNAFKIQAAAYNTQAVEVILKALFDIYEQESPGVQQRILERIGSNPLAASLLSIVANSGEGSTF